MQSILFFFFGEVGLMICRKLGNSLEEKKEFAKGSF